MLLMKFEGHEDIVSSVAFSPDGSKIVSRSDDQTPFKKGGFRG